MRKLTPLMQKHYATALRVGYLDPIETGAKTGTIVGLMERGLIREAKGHAGRHHLATTAEEAQPSALCEHLEREHAAGRLVPDWSPEAWSAWMIKVRALLSGATLEEARAAR